MSSVTLFDSTFNLISHMNSQFKAFINLCLLVVVVIAIVAWINTKLAVGVVAVLGILSVVEIIRQIRGDNKTVSVPKVILIDDDHGPMEYFTAALGLKKISWAHLDSVDKTMDFLKRMTTEVGLFVVDMAMPPGHHMSMEETNNGMTTGTIIVQKIREKFPRSKIMVFTNFNDLEILGTLPKDVRVRFKFEVSPMEFADEIQGLLAV
jgi:hypothetical protein